MKEKELTAVEWLIDQISKSGIGNHTMIVHKKEIEQAKVMEEQEKVEFALKAYLGTFNSDKSFNDMVDSMRTLKQQEQ
jgi:hypothetical protein